jgi:hypothetical protein
MVLFLVELHTFAHDVLVRANVRVSCFAFANDVVRGFVMCTDGVAAAATIVYLTTV